MPEVRLLDELTINQIAAGEVVENPASVVKELIDNALDAKAKEIIIDIRQGGRTLIRLQDNGHGMEREDALLSLERHATSKIASVEDLFRIDTMGFRGEALPSITSISRFVLHTKKENQSTFIQGEGGKILLIDDREKTRGTLVEVKDLFFNVPVRKKFQKSPAYDVQEILKTTVRLSLANPQVSFELTSDNEMLFKTKNFPKEKEILKDRITDALGPEFLEDAIPLNAEGRGITIGGYLGSPLLSRPNRLAQYLFINRRPVFSPFISACISESYGSALPSGRFPSFVLHLTAPKELIDINVHPQKKEVRLRHFEEFKKIIRDAVQKSLFGKPSTVSLSSSFVIAPPHLGGIKDSFPFREEKAWDEEPPILPSQEPPSFPFFQEAQEELSVLFVGDDIALIKGSLERQGSALFSIIDLEAAKETLLFRQIQKTSPHEMVLFLIPYVFTLNPEDTLLVKEHLPFLEERGVSLRQVGEKFSLEGLPAHFGDLDLTLFIKELVESFKEAKNFFLEEVLTKKMVRSILHASSRNKIFSSEEVVRMVKALNSLNFPLFSPLGKAIYADFDSKRAKKALQENLGSAK